MFFRKYFVSVIFISLLIWGPIDHSWPGWLVIRISYLILIPVIVWFLLGWVWSKWQLNGKLENTLERILSSLICIVLLIIAILEAKSDTHVGNTKWIQSRDGMEAVGDDIIVKGPDWGNVFILIIIVVFVFWFGVLKKNYKSSG